MVLMQRFFDFFKIPNVYYNKQMNDFEKLRMIVLLSFPQQGCVDT